MKKEKQAIPHRVKSRKLIAIPGEPRIMLPVETYIQVEECKDGYKRIVVGKEVHHLAPHEADFRSWQLELCRTCAFERFDVAVCRKHCLSRNCNFEQVWHTCEQDNAAPMLESAETLFPHRPEPINPKQVTE